LTSGSGVLIFLSSFLHYTLCSPGGGHYRRAGLKPVRAEFVFSQKEEDIKGVINWLSKPGVTVIPAFYFFKL